MAKTFLSARWEDLIMANYEVSPEVLAPYLPHGTDLDYYEDKTYVSLVGFMFKQSRLFNVPIPFFGTFEEINLRFYVKRVEGNVIKRGVVFINETVPHRSVAWLANKLYKENYITVPTKNTIIVSDRTKNINYQWKTKAGWNHIEADVNIRTEAMPKNSLEEFIFEHYYGYTKINERLSQEYKVNHPRWRVHKLLDYSVNCDFDLMYGSDFSFLNDSDPDSVIVAEGSAVTIDWKRHSF